jgi:hypothetical protein
VFSRPWTLLELWSVPVGTLPTVTLPLQVGGLGDIVGLREGAGGAPISDQPAPPALQQFDL